MEEHGALYGTISHVFFHYEESDIWVWVVKAIEEKSIC